MSNSSNATQAAHPLDPALVSAYYDDALTAAERHVVEEHLARCPACRERLAAYASLGGAIRAGVDPKVPATLDRRVAVITARGRLAAKSGPGGAKPAGRRLSLTPWPIPAALAAVVVLGVLVGAFLFGLPFVGGAVGPTIASAYPCTDPSECAIALQFTGPVDHASVEKSFQIEPPVGVTFAWQGNTLLVKPTQPLQPAVTYTASLRAPGGQASTLGRSAATPTPVALHFVARGAGSPVVMASARSAGSTVASPSSQPSASTSAAATPLPAASATAIVAVPVVSPTPCSVKPVRGFGTLYQNQPSVAARLGCAQASEAGVDMVAEPFEHGRMLWRGDRRIIFALLDDGHWSSYPDTFTGTETVTPAPGEPVRGFGKVWRDTPKLHAALGATTASEQPIRGAIQEFQHGTLVWTADRVIYVLYTDGLWEQYPDTFVDATETAAAATPTVAATPATATPVPGQSPVVTATTAGNASTPVPTATESASSGASTCLIQPIRGFGLVYAGHPEVADHLGCATSREIGAGSTRQTFERGLMIRRDDVRQIYVVRGDGTWAVYPDTYEDSETLPDVGVVPTGRLAPARGFGKLWRQQPSLRQALGWATAAPQSVTGAFQDFAAGRMLWTSDRLVYALFADGTWRSFPDTFVDSTPTPAPR